MIYSKLKKMNTYSTPILFYKKAGNVVLNL